MSVAVKKRAIGERVAPEQLFIRVERKYGGHVRRWIDSRIRGSIWRSEGEDLTQDVFLALWKVLVTKGTPDQVCQQNEEESWLRAMLFRLAKFRLSRLYSDSGRTWTNVDCLERDPGLWVNHVLRRMTLQEAVECCSPDGWETVALRVEGYSDQEIAERQGVSKPCVRTRRRRARQVLQRTLLA